MRTNSFTTLEQDNASKIYMAHNKNIIMNFYILYTTTLSLVI